MRAFHNSTVSEFRSPFGAVPVDTQVRLCLDVWDDPLAQAYLRTWVDGEGETLYPMQSQDMCDYLHFSINVSWDTPQVVWYYFAIEASDGTTWRYGASAEDCPGEGAFAYGEPPSFQITVYEHSRSVYPDWYTEGIVYQIFPDRFYRSDASKERAEALFDKECKAGRKGPKRRFVDDWNKAPTYEKDEAGRVVAWDFYGGDLDGICEKLDYIQSLGASILYLNPIFTAASNHRYDTANYLEVDPLLGGNEAFVRLVEDLHARGMHLILDGVFNHVGSDSPYFNRYGNYPEPGAYQGGSAYDEWFTKHEDNTFDAWWGIDDLPAVREDAKGYKALILGSGGVVSHWLSAGADGWRLDVADELSDEFIQDIKAQALKTKPDSVLIGEVWEDASHKIAYGKLRKYFLGQELDGVMNYPLRDAILQFILEVGTAPQVATRLHSLANNYPKEALYSCLNLMGSHDRMRLLWLLAEAPSQDTLSEDEKASWRPDAGQMDLAISRLWVATLLQMLMPGVPSIYYGDEAGLGGFSDPHNRASFPWDRIHQDALAIYRNAIALRKSIPTFTRGAFEPFAIDVDVLGFKRWDEENVLYVLANASLHDSKEFTLELPKELIFGLKSGELVADDIVGGQHLELDSEGALKIFLWPLGTSVIYIRRAHALVEPMEPGVGYLEHVTSLAGTAHTEAGKIGVTSCELLEKLGAQNITYWQILPLNPTDSFGSPYAGLSAFAGNTNLLDAKTKEAFLQLSDTDPELLSFVDSHGAWLKPYACFMALKHTFGVTHPWQEWPDNYLHYSEELFAETELQVAIWREIKLQFAFQKTWDKTRDKAREQGVHIIGDMPMYVSADSADVWAHPELFKLDSAGRPLGQAGAPPDNFAADGQLWGNPTYLWECHAREGYSWWLSRFERAFALYDYVRLDHFLGFSSYFEIPKDKSAKEGAWHFGPGLALFRAAYKALGPLPIIAEDLGIITPAVRALMAAVGAYGMDVIQFSDTNPAVWKPKVGKIAYTATHDTQTICGFVGLHYGKDSTDDQKKRAFELVDRVLTSEAAIKIVTPQDLLLMDDTKRMNVPGVAEGNWSWMASASEEDKAIKLLGTYTKD